MVVDTSVLLAVLFHEDAGSWAVEQLHTHADALVMSTVNLAETLIRARDRNPVEYPAFAARLLASGIRFVPPDVPQARTAARARLDLRALNFGDCFAYALAVAEGLPILTLDADFLTTGHHVVHPANTP